MKLTLRCLNVESIFLPLDTEKQVFLEGEIGELRASFYRNPYARVTRQIEIISRICCFAKARNRSAYPTCRGREVRYWDLSRNTDLKN